MMILSNIHIILILIFLLIIILIMMISPGSECGQPCKRGRRDCSLILLSAPDHQGGDAGVGGDQGDGDGDDGVAKR